MSKFGIYPTIITPFTSEGIIDWDSLKRLVNLFADIGCEGVFAVCQSSEMFFLSEVEKLELARETLALCRSRGLRCVISGHTQDGLDSQIEYLRAIEALRPDAVILVSNRLASEGEGDDIAVTRLERILASLKNDTPLGVYECPYPYRRPLTDAILKVMIADGRFRFVKDTCCEIAVIRERLKMLSGTGIELYNANMATLLESIDSGASGFSGIMANIAPEFFSILRRAYIENDRARVEKTLSCLSALGTIEYQNYPANAKYILMKRGITRSCITRNGKPTLTESQTKELDAYISLCKFMYFSLVKRSPYTLLAGYDEYFHECHASSVLPLDNGSVLTVYFAGTHEGANDVGIWISKRENGEWRKPHLIAKVNDTAHWNPVLFYTNTGIRLVFKVGENIPGWKSYTMLSTDFGKSWSAPKAFDASNPAGGPVRGKPIVLSDGRILAPNSDETADAWLPRVDMSVDGGNTFKRFASIPINREDTSAHDYMSGKGAIQPALWESAPGKVHAFLRTRAGFVYRSDSNDGGGSWCVAYPTGIPNNNSGIDIVKVRSALYLVLNPVSGSNGVRTPLVIMRSVDNGQSFEDYRVLANDMFDDFHACNGQFCYPAITERNDTLYITFTYNRKSIAYSEIRLWGSHTNKI